MGAEEGKESAKFLGGPAEGGPGQGVRRRGCPVEEMKNIKNKGRGFGLPPLPPPSPLPLSRGGLFFLLFSFFLSFFKKIGGFEFGEGGGYYPPPQKNPNPSAASTTLWPDNS